MPLVRFRLTGSRADADADAVIALLHGIDGVEHVEEVEEVDDLISGIREDSSDSESVSDSEARLYAMEIDAPSQRVADTVREYADVIARERDAGIEFTDNF